MSVLFSVSLTESAQEEDCNEQSLCAERYRLLRTVGEGTDG